MEIAGALETYASFRELALQGSGFMRAKMYITLRKRALKRSFYYLLSLLCDWVVGE